MTSSAFVPGDVVSLDFPFSGGVGEKQRPALVLGGPSVHGDYTVAMISRSQQDDGISIASPDFAAGSLSVGSFVRVRHLFTCETGAFVTKRGTLRPAAMTRVLPGSQIRRKMGATRALAGSTFRITNTPCKPLRAACSTLCD